MEQRFIAAHTSAQGKTFCNSNVVLCTPPRKRCRDPGVLKGDVFLTELTVLRPLEAKPLVIDELGRFEWIRRFEAYGPYERDQTSEYKDTNRAEARFVQVILEHVVHAPKPKPKPTKKKKIDPRQASTPRRSTPISRPRLPYVECTTGSESEYQEVDDYDDDGPVPAPRVTRATAAPAKPTASKKLRFDGVEIMTPLAHFSAPPWGTLAAVPSAPRLAPAPAPTAAAESAKPARKPRDALAPGPSAPRPAPAAAVESSGSCARHAKYTGAPPERGSTAGSSSGGCERTTTAFKNGATASSGAGRAPIPIDPPPVRHASQPVPQPLPVPQPMAPPAGFQWPAGFDAATAQQFAAFMYMMSMGQQGPAQ
ncbi:hypothetical protein K438DRAFT_1781505 [Mycena galopus ATCC 62051]|nr:hypothetical protein K438DRAFT_1781505 [Mycena galopus ATCC 62051]